MILLSMLYPSLIVYTFYFIINNNISELTWSCISFLTLGEYQVCGEEALPFHPWQLDCEPVRSLQDTSFWGSGKCSARAFLMAQPAVQEQSRGP